MDPGPDQQAADVLTWRYSATEIRLLLDGPLEQVRALVSFGARP